MLHQVTIFSVIIAAFAIQARQLDRGPQSFKKLNSSLAGAAQNQQKRFVARDIVVYLTPNQIQDLQSGNMELRSHSSGEITLNQFQNEQRVRQQNSPSSYNSRRENQNILKAPLVQEAQAEGIEQEQQEERFFNGPQLYLFNQENLRQVLPQLLRSGQVQDNNNNDWRPRNQQTVDNSEEQSFENQNNKQWQNGFLNNYEVAKPASNGFSNQPENVNTEARQQQYIPNYNRFTQALVYENAFRQQNNEMENQQAPENEDASADASPVVEQQEENINNNQRPVMKIEANEPDQSPVPELQPYEVRVQQRYPAPVEIIKRLPIPAVEAERNVAEKTLSYDLRKQHHGKNVYINVDSPSYLQVWKN